MPVTVSATPDVAASAAPILTKWSAIKAFSYVAEALYLVLVPSSSLSGRARVERLAHDEHATSDGQGRVVVRETRETVHNTVEAADGVKLRDAVRNACDAIGYKLDGAAGFAVRGDDMAALIKRTDAILANASEFNAGAVHCRVTVRTPHVIPADAASMADVISGSLGDALSAIRNACKRGLLPGGKGEARGDQNLRAVLIAYKHLHKLGQGVYQQNAIRDALTEAKEIKAQIETWIEAQATAPDAAAIATFAGAIPTNLIDQAITLCVASDHPVWDEIKDDPTVVADAGTPPASEAAAIDDLGGLL